jgi:hypothetical protein
MTLLIDGNGWGVTGMARGENRPAEVWGAAEVGAEFGDARQLPVPGKARLGAHADDLKDEFRKLVAEWKASRGPTSSAMKMAAHPAYKKIIGLGRDVVPLLLAELEREPDHWFVALYTLTGAEPVPEQSRGRLKEMAAAWVAWGKANGFSC